MNDRFIEFLITWIIMPFLSVCCIVLGVMIVKSAYRSSQPSPKITLTKADWTCTQYVTEDNSASVLVGNVIVPIPHTSKRCTQWSKTGTELEE